LRYLADEESVQKLVEEDRPLRGHRRTIQLDATVALVFGYTGEGFMDGNLLCVEEVKDLGPHPAVFDNIDLMLERAFGTWEIDALVDVNLEAAIRKRLRCRWRGYQEEREKGYEMTFHRNISHIVMAPMATRKANTRAATGCRKR
jgi:hypothetical protein